MNQGIPRRLIQTGKSTDLPLLSQAAAANIRLLNPDFEYLFFDDRQVEAFIDEHYPEYRRTFDSYRYPIQRYDLFRYLAVYRLGGFYFDLDVLLSSPLEPLLRFNCVFPFEQLTLSRFLRDDCGMDWELGNYAFGAAPGHPFLRAIIDNCVRAQNDPAWAGTMMRSVPRWFRDDLFVLTTTGPQLVSRTLAEFPDADQQVEVLFPHNVCDADTWFQFGTYGVHLMVGGWRSRQGVLRRRLMNDWTTMTRRRLLPASLALGQRRSLKFARGLHQPSPSAG